MSITVYTVIQLFEGVFYTYLSKNNRQKFVVSYVLNFSDNNSSRLQKQGVIVPVFIEGGQTNCNPIVFFQYS